MKEWTEDISVEFWDTGESINLGSTNEIKKKGFDRIVEMVSSEDIFCPVFLSYILEKSIPFGASGFLNSFFSFPSNVFDIRSSESDYEIIFFTKIFHEKFISITLGSSEMVVEMSDDDMIFWMERENLRHEEHTVRTSGTSDDECVIVGNLIFLRESF